VLVGAKRLRAFELRPLCREQTERATVELDEAELDEHAQRSAAADRSHRHDDVVQRAVGSGSQRDVDVAQRAPQIEVATVNMLRTG